MNITINIEESQLTDLINKTTNELGEEFFTDIMKAAFSEYIKKELDCAFACLDGQYISGNRNTDQLRRAESKSILRSLFVKETKSGYGFGSNTVTYQPTEYLANIIKDLNIKEELEKHRDRLINILHEHTDEYIHEGYRHSRRKRS
jgi:hypothetical protein